MIEVNSKYICECCGRIQRPDHSLIQVDDRVRIVADIAGEPRNLRGIVIGFRGSSCFIEIPGDRTVQRAIDAVYPQDAPPPLDYVHKKVCACSVQKLSTVPVNNSAGVQAHV